LNHFSFSFLQHFSLGRHSLIDKEAIGISDLMMADEEDFDFQLFASDEMPYSTNDDDRRKIEEIETDLINSLQKYASSSICTLNNLSQENVASTKNMERQQQFELINNNGSSTNLNPIYMDVHAVSKEREQISSNPNTTVDDEQHFDNINEINGKLLFQRYAPPNTSNNNFLANTTQHDQTSQPLTTGKCPFRSLTLSNIKKKY
jgi:hypothetical protein